MTTIMPNTERRYERTLPSSASARICKFWLRSLVFEIQDDSDELISSFGTHIVSIGTGFVIESD